MKTCAYCFLETNVLKEYFSFRQFGDIYEVNDAQFHYNCFLEIAGRKFVNEFCECFGNKDAHICVFCDEKMKIDEGDYFGNENFVALKLCFMGGSLVSVFHRECLESVCPLNLIPERRRFLAR